MWRMLVVFSIALLFGQGAFAHEHVTQLASAGATLHVRHMVGTELVSGELARPATGCPEGPATGASCRHDHSGCCTNACGFHCCVFSSAVHFEPRAPNVSIRLPVSEPCHDSVTHAPLLRPPIVS
ncbi:MAG: hypothetical protein EPN73_19480 [Paraburkholderia sp.]|uniref:hypothetical protein n=1 Tax=Paraburkholderia sp. TaxID=1926495 RepID=UPI0011FD1DF2|nr:hypothetical protein [Paraburkholderia sp.]TAL93986.1 MAG: hypothetical protein EPN73_19480 [Paraburkholderia sp.]